MIINMRKIDLSYQKNVRDLGGLFSADYMLTTLDLSMFDTSNVYDMSTTFSGTYSGNTSALTTIYASDKWVTTKVSTNSSYRLYTFSNDVNLVGGAGTIYDPNHVDCDYAHIDGGLANPGYFTEKAFSGHYTIFFPDYRVSPIYDGEVFTVPQNTYTKDNQILSTVTFDYQDGRPDYTSQVYKKFTPAGWTADNRTYSANTNITVHKDYVFEPRYTEGTVGATFPEDPVREGYTFLGWYTVGGTKYTSYTGTSDRTLYARWAKNENVDEVTITYPDGSKETVPVGTEITLPKPLEKEDDSYPVTFKPENGEGDIIKYVTKSYIVVQHSLLYLCTKIKKIL